MTCSPARLAANIANARKSTGPRTPEGKERSRANALKHGFCSEVVRAPEDDDAINLRSKLYGRTLKPQDDFHAWIVEVVASLTLKIDRLGRIERGERDRIALRAEHFWDDDRRGEAEALGAGLAGDPARVRERLRQTLHGCEWMMIRWALLARVADRNGAWDEAQTALACDLLGSPPKFRATPPGEAIDLDGRVDGDESMFDPARLARREIAALRERMHGLAEADDLDRALARAGLADASSPDLRRLRRYESDLHRRLRWCMDQLHKESKSFKPHPSPQPPFDRDAEPEPQSEAPAESAAALSAPGDVASPPAEVAPPTPEPTPAAEPEPFPDRPVPAPSKSRRDPARLKAEAKRRSKRARKDQRLRA